MGRLVQGKHNTPGIRGVYVVGASSPGQAQYTRHKRGVCSGASSPGQAQYTRHKRGVCSGGV